MRPVCHFVAVILLTACSADRITSPKLEPLYGKGQVDTDSRARFSFADSLYVADSGRYVRAGIQGDSRQINGAPAAGALSNEYQGDWCGVNARIEIGADLDLDPDVGYVSSTMSAACGAKREYRFFLAGTSSAPTGSGPHSQTYGLALLAAGQSSTLAGGFGVQLPNCQRLMFDSQYAQSASLQRTRLPDLLDAGGRTVRQWRIESQGSHRAMCVVPGRGTSFIPTGVTYFLPFAITVIEVPYPFSRYP